MSPDSPPPIAPFHETPSPMGFELALQRLSSTPENLSQLTPADINLAEIRHSLVEAGCNLALGEAERASLAERQFRNLGSGRGLGVVAVLSPERAVAVMEYVQQLSEGRGKIGGKEGTEGRGLRQFLADTLQLATAENPTDEDVVAYCVRVNERAFKGYRKAKEYKNDPVAQETIGRAFTGVEDKTDVGEFSSIPPQTLDKLWAFILGK